MDSSCFINRGVQEPNEENIEVYFRKWHRWSCDCFSPAQGFPGCSLIRSGAPPPLARHPVSMTFGQHTGVLNHISFVHSNKSLSARWPTNKHNTVKICVEQTLLLSPVKNTLTVIAAKYHE